MKDKQKRAEEIMDVLAQLILDYIQQEKQKECK